MTYACVRTDNMSGTVNGKDLVSLKFMVSETEAPVENGNVVLVGDYLEGEREVRKATAPSKNADVYKCALVASEEVVKSKSRNTLAEFRNEAGDIARGYRLVANDTFSVTAEAFADGAALEVGATVELTDSTKLSAVAEATGAASVVGKIVLIENEWYVIEVA